MFIFLVAGFVASLISAYNAGWQSGHDLHHVDGKHGDNTPETPSKGLYL